MKKKSESKPEISTSFKCAYCKQEFINLNLTFAHMYTVHERKTFASHKQNIPALDDTVQVESDKIIKLNKNIYKYYL